VEIKPRYAAILKQPRICHSNRGACRL